jgi:hypothetical protein
VHCCDSHLHCSQGGGWICRVSNTTGAALTHPHPQNSRYTPRCLSVVLWTPCSGVWWRVFEPTIRVWRSGTTRKQAANLGFESAEESLSILPDYTPTVRPPPKRC